MQKNKILFSTLIILVVMAASLGATFAWFTDQSEEIENVFTAGTVSLNAGEEWAYGTGLENWNPGDCTDKEIYLEYTGSKKAFLRMQIEEIWVDTEDENGDGTWYDRSVPNVDWKINKGTEADPDWQDWNVDGKWFYHDADPSDGEGGWWYYDGDYDGVDAELYTHTIGGESFKAVSGLAEGETPDTITIIAQVCLNGPLTGNTYQGAKYTLEVVFQAIQASHSEDWQWENVNFETGLVE